MSMGRTIPGSGQRVCHKCGAPQESPGSTVCEECGADLIAPEVTSNITSRVTSPFPPRPRPQLGQRLPQLGQRLGATARRVLQAPVRFVRGVLAAVEALVAFIMRVVSFTLRAAATLLVLGALVIGLSFVPEVRARVPGMNTVQAFAIGWIQRAEDQVRKVLAEWKAAAQPGSRTSPPAAAPKPASPKPTTLQKSTAATPQKSAASRGVATKPSLTIKSTPAGATVMLNARRVGKTPMTLKVAPGTYTVKVSRTGYLSVIRKVTVKAGTPASLQITLTAAP